MTMPHKDKPRLIIVEDETDFRENAITYLEASGYPVWGTGSADGLYRHLANNTADILILDVGLPGESGFEIAQYLSQHLAMGIIILSAHNTVQDRLTGLGCGADCYLTKPIEFTELIANIEAIWRRVKIARTEAQPTPPASTPGWLLDKRRWVLQSPSGLEYRLTSREFLFLEQLVHAQGQPVSRPALAKALGGSPLEYDYHRMDVLISRLRKKGGQALGEPLPIKTLQNHGFAFTADCATT